MSLLRWDPFRELEEMNRRLSRVLTPARATDDGDRESMTLSDWLPTVDVSETDKAYAVHVSIPGVKKEDLKLSVENRVLTVSGERKQRSESKGERYHRVETSYGRFARTFALPDDADESKVDAEYRDGVLDVKIAKSEKARPRSIDVKVS